MTARQYSPARKYGRQEAPKASNTSEFAGPPAMVMRTKTTEVTAKAVAVPTGRRKSLSFSSASATLILKPPFQLGQRSEHDAPYRPQCVGTASVERVLRGMVVAAKEGSKVDDVHGRHAGREKGQVIVLD